MKKKQNTLIFIFRESVGELNVALPIINRLISYIDYSDIIFYITSKKKYSKIDSLYIDIMNNLGNIYIDKNKLVKIILENSLNNVTLVTTDKAPKIEYNLINKFLNTTTILMHHSQTIFYKKGLELEYKSNKKNTVNDTYKPDFFLVGNTIDLDNNFYSSFNYEIPKEKVFFIGALSYEDSWLKNIVDKNHSNLNHITNKQTKFKKTILVTTRGPHKDCMEEKDYFYQVNSILKLANKLDNFLFIIKPHPREKIKIYKNAFSNSTNNIIISNYNAYKLCSISDLVISFWSSVIQDCSIMGKPVIEFHRHTSKNSKMLIKTGDKFQSYFQYYGFSFYVDNYKDLLTIVSNGIDEKELENHNKNIKNIFLIDNHKITNTLNSIKKVIENKKIYKKYKIFNLYFNFFKYLFFKKKKN